MSNFACDDDTENLSSSYSEMQGLLEAVNRYAAAVGTCITTPKTKAMSALISDKQRQIFFFDGEPLEDVDQFWYRYFGSVVSRETNKLPLAVFDDKI